MTTTTRAEARPELDLTVSRVIRAPRAAIWRAWTDPRRFERWWVPAPTVCRVVDLDVRPGGSFRTEVSDDGSAFGPHLAACFLDVVEQERIVWTTALLGGWRPSGQSFVTAVITLADHPEGTAYTATAMHASVEDRDQHASLGFIDGWGAVVAQLAAQVEEV